ncbi:hypothetical protein M0657_004108 [Pyricularia oryzae]|nr:hypothetical protein M0657_004108 [Pyricularia oryzae]KAI7926643.1 hypothetical protein M9X92_002657 [Pyricularia oryzae]
MDRSPMRQELSAALSPFRTRVESCNHEALAWLVRQAEEAQTTPARPVPGNVPDLEHLDRYTYDVLGARVRSIEHRTSNPLDCTRSLCMQSCLAEWENKKQIRTMCLAQLKPPGQQADKEPLGPLANRRREGRRQTSSRREGYARKQFNSPQSFA